MIGYDYDNHYFIIVDPICLTNVGMVVWFGKVCVFHCQFGQDAASNTLMRSAIHRHSFASILTLWYLSQPILPTVLNSPRRVYPHRFETFHETFVRIYCIYIYHISLAQMFAFHFPNPKKPHLVFSFPRKRRLISPEQMPLGMDPKALLKMLDARGEDWRIIWDNYYQIPFLGGGNSNIFLMFTPKIGEDFHFD